MSVARYVPFELGQPAAAPSAPPDAALSQVSREDDAREGLFPDYGKGEDFRRFKKAPEKTLATIATLADPRPWSGGLERLLTLPRPRYVSASRWEELQFDAVRFDRDWGAQALASGWSLLNIFGIWPDPSRTRLDCHGLVALLSGREVASLTPDHAKIDLGRERFSTFVRRHQQANASPLWEAYARGGGP